MYVYIFYMNRTFSIVRSAMDVSSSKSFTKVIGDLGIDQLILKSNCIFFMISSSSGHQIIRMSTA